MMKWVHIVVMRFAITIVLVVLGSCSFMTSCVGQRWAPREEPVKDIRMPVVYNAGYNIHIFGADLFSMFDLKRYRRVYDGLKSAGVVNRHNVIVPRAVTDEELLMVHTRDWITRTKDKREVARVFGTGPIAWFSERYVQDNVVAPFRMQTRGTVLAARLALKYGIACNIGGGFAHASRKGGEGFNLFADVPLAIQTLRNDEWKGKVMIIDVDIHHGQGNAIFFADDPTVFVMDIYNRDNYPYKFEEVDIAVEVPRGTDDSAYLKSMKELLPAAIDRFKPSLVIYVAGVDCHIDDRIGGAALTEDGIFLRDKFAIDACRDRDIPMCLILSGGYWDRCWRCSVRMMEYAAQKQGEN